MRGIHLARALIALASVSFLAAPLPAEPMEDVDYVLIEPHPSAVSGKIEVIEFFHYGCAACYRFEPLLGAWLERLPADVSFRRVPALRRVDWIPLTRLYFALEELGEIGRLHGQVYRDLHGRELNLGNSTEALAWGIENGLDRHRFEQALNSDRVSANVQQARDATVANGVRATPSLVVDGRYLTGAGMVGSVEALLPVIDGLINKARAARTKQ